MTGLLLWALCGIVMAAGLLGVITGLAGTIRPKEPSLTARLRARTTRTGHDIRMRRRARLLMGGVVGALLWLVSGVFVTGLLVVVAMVGVPWLLATTKGAAARIGKLEALGDWTQRLANVLRLGRGLDEALKVSRKGVPEPIAEEVGDLVDRLQVGWRASDALREFGNSLDDVTADKVVAALILSAEDRGPGLAQALEDLADSVHEEVAKRRTIESDREKPRTTVRWMTMITLAVVGTGLLVPSYTAPYGSLLGQLVLALLTAGFIAVLAWMRQLADHRSIPRFLVADARSRVSAPAAPSGPVLAGEATP